MKEISKDVGFWLLTVQQQHRIRLYPELFKRLKFLNPIEGFSITLIGRLGPNGQLLVHPREREEVVLNKVKESLKVMPATHDDVAAPWMHLARYLAFGWHLPCSFEPAGNRFSLTLPEEARDLGIIPNESERLIILQTGEILEIWPYAKCIEYLTNISSELKKYAALSIQELIHRDEKNS